jgi:hypothetical protein
VGPRQPFRPAGGSRRELSPSCARS